MQIHNLIQGTAEWNEHRAKHFNASDAPAMMGVSPYESRDQLLHRLHTGIAKEVDAATQRRFDDGHRFEALARPIAEQIIGDDLSPVTGSSSKYSASFDGLTMDYSVGFEHKTLNDDIRGCTSADDLPEMYLVQMEQQCLVSGSERVLFLATRWGSDGTLTEKKWFWYVPDEKLRERIIAGWEQFEKDLAAYTPREAKQPIKTEAAEAFPVPSIAVRGEVVACNLADITPRFDRFLAETNTTLVTDEDFAQGEVDAKASREAAKNCKLTAKAVVDQIAPVSEVVRTLEKYAADFDALGLRLEKSVKDQKEAIKANAISTALVEWTNHVEALEAEIRPIRMSLVKPDFAGAIRGLKTIASMQSNIGSTLANAKADADIQARDIRAKLAWCKDNAAGMSMLFPDLQQIIGKPMDDFTLLIQSRIDAHNQKEKEKLEAERIRIEAEVKAKATPKPEESKPEPVAAAMPPANTNKATASLRDAKPGVQQLVDTVAKAYGVSSDVALAWLAETDFEATVAQELRAA